MDLTHVPTLKALLARHGLAPTKRFGQHFLVSSRVVDAILNAVPADVSGVLEVGPGPGVLTRPLSERARRLIAFEIDPIAVSALSESAPRAEVRQADVLRVDFKAALGDLPTPRWIVSNMPYNITGPLLALFCGARAQIEGAVLMMQKEVGDKITAPSGSAEFGSISVLLQSRFEISTVAHAPGSAFFPPPKVDSLVLRLIPKREAWTPEFDALHERVARQAFTQPRKTLANNLKAAGHDRTRLDAWLSQHGYGESVRPHQVRLEDWRTLAEALA